VILLLSFLGMFHAIAEMEFNCDVGDLEENTDFSSGGYDWHIFYTDNTNYLSDPSDYVPASRAAVGEMWVKSNVVKQLFEYNFPGYSTAYDPDFNVYFHDIVHWDKGADTVFGWYNGYCFVLDSVDLQDTSAEKEIAMWKTAAHEMFHGIQYYYVSRGDGGGVTLGKWFSEGTARFMDDRWYTFHDGGTFSGSFNDQAGSFLSSSTAKSLFDLEYGACLFWSYLAEQLGANQYEPGRGFDFITSLLEQIESDISADGYSTRKAADATIRSYDSRQSFDTMFRRFTLCNLLRMYDTTALPDGILYRYKDEQIGNDAGAPDYDDTAMDSLGTSALGAGILSPYAARFLEITGMSNFSCTAIGFKGSGLDMAFGVAAVNAANEVMEVASGEGEEWGRTYLVSADFPVKKMAIALNSLNADTSYSINIATGNVALSIIRPNFEAQAYPGVHNDPGRILARVVVRGPSGLEPDGAGTRSILGLTKENFRARVCTNDAAIISSGYVSGEYWLTIQAPNQDFDRSCDLSISICGGDNGYVSSANAVLYGDIIVNHVITIDNSGSMNYPATGATKLDIAKDAAQLYVDSVADDDRLAVVTFSGNGSECDDDSVAVGTNKMLSANFLTRILYKLGIEYITPSNRTSIGDGIWRARDLLATAPPTNKVVINNILLLSDGKENEARYWDATNCLTGGKLSDQIVASNIWINAIALGGDADQGLMQTIGTMTDGDYSFVDVYDGGAALAGVQPPGVSGVTPPGPTPSTMLADTFMDMLARARGLERLHYSYGELTAGAAITSVIRVTEGGVENGLFYFHSSKDNTGLSVELRDPAGALVSGATLMTGSAHRVYHMSGTLSTGEYRAVLAAASNTQFSAGLFGNPSNEVHVTLAFSQVDAVATNGQNREEVIREQYQEGVPVGIVAMVTDRFGPVTNAAVTVNIRRPDGVYACGPVQLYDNGRGIDARQQDGIYSGIFRDTRLASYQGADRDAFPGPSTPTNRGSYSVTLVTTGQVVSGETFLRESRGSFHVYRRLENRDTDADGLPDSWEELYGTTSMLPSADPDADTLNNSNEYFNGTHPFHPDSDGGGEADGSEVAAGRCPANPADDAFGRLADVEVIDRLGDEGTVGPRPLANLIRFEKLTGYTAMRIERATNAAGPFALVTNLLLAAPSTPYYFDENLTNNVKYYYRLRAGGAGGSFTPYSRVVSGTARNDPEPPIGSIKINHNYPLTDSTNVLLTFRASADTVLMRIAETGDVSAVAAITYTNRLAYTLRAPGPVPAPREVHVQFGDAAGNWSRESWDRITYNPATAGTADDDGDGLSDVDETFVHFTDPFRVDTDGDGLSDSNEVVTTGSDARRSDTDADDLPDGMETNGLSLFNPDSDGDGMPDGWEVVFGLNASNPADADDDDDGDGVSNVREYWTGTRPDNTGSVFKANAAPLPVGGTNIIITFPSVRRGKYRIYESTNLMGNGWSLAGPTITATVSKTTTTVPVRNAEPGATIRIDKLPENP